MAVLAAKYLSPFKGERDPFCKWDTSQVPQAKQLCCTLITLNIWRNLFQASNYSQSHSAAACSGCYPQTPKLVKDFHRLQMKNYMFQSHPTLISLHSAVPPRVFCWDFFLASTSRFGSSFIPI